MMAHAGPWWMVRRGALARQAARATEADRGRAALLTAVSHDLRAPLAAAKAAVSGLRSYHARLTEADRLELLATAEESLDQLAQLAESLLDVSRLQAGALPVFPGPPIWARLSRAPSMTSGRRRERSGPTSRPGCPRSWPTRRSWNGSSRT